MQFITLLKKSNQKYSVQFNNELYNIKYIFNFFLKNKIGIIKDQHNVSVGTISFSKKVKFFSKEESYEIIFKSKRYTIYGDKTCWKFNENNNEFKVKKEYSRKYSYQLYFNNIIVGKANYSYKVFKSKAVITINNDMDKNSLLIFSLMFVAVSTFKYLSSYTNNSFDSNF